MTPAPPPSDDRPGRSRGAPAGAELRRLTPPVGPVDGWIDGDLLRATGIRYAVADRFGLPRPAPDHREPLAATRWSAASPQTYDPMGDHLFSAQTRELDVDEHPQRLSVTAPADAGPEAALPVIVWIHGGSNLTGTGDSSISDPALLVREQRGVVVTVTYRLGALGYLGGDGRPANLGLLDQAQALRWVRRNIGAFGGDAHRVTAMGESAGADAIAHLLAAFPDDPLCDRAIVQSPPLGIRRGRARMTAAASRALRRLDESSGIEELLAVEDPVHSRSLRHGIVGVMPFGVEYGHEPMPAEDEVERAWERVAPRVPLLIGGMGSEFSLFTRQTPFIARGRVPAWAERRVIGPIERWGERRVFSRGIDEMAGIWRAAGGEVLRYRIPWAAPGNPFGSPHGMDVALQFGGREVWEGAGVVRGSRWEDFERAGRVLRAVWGAFARGEDVGPGTPGVIEVTASGV